MLRNSKPQFFQRSTQRSSTNDTFTVSTLLKFLLFLAQLNAVFARVQKSAFGGICFESSAGNDYTLDCKGDLESKILPFLTSTCGVYNDVRNDCANYFVDQKDFGSGYFGGTWCTLSYHVSSPDECIANIVTDHSPSHKFGTTYDQWSTAGIVIGSLIGLVVLSGIGIVIHTSHKERKAKRNLEEGTPLLSQPENFKQIKQIMPLFFQGRMQQNSYISRLPRDFLIDVAAKVGMGKGKYDKEHYARCKVEAIKEYKAAGISDKNDSLKTNTKIR